MGPKEHIAKAETHKPPAISPEAARRMSVELQRASAGTLASSALFLLCAKGRAHGHQMHVTSGRLNVLWSCWHMRENRKGQEVRQA
jgi:hypothetical protein